MYKIIRYMQCYSNLTSIDTIPNSYSFLLLCVLKALSKAFNYLFHSGQTPMTQKKIRFVESL